MRVSVLDFARIPSSPQRVTSWGVGEEEENRQRPHRWLPIRWRHRPTQPLQIPQPFRSTSPVPPINTTSSSSSNVSLSPSPPLVLLPRRYLPMPFAATVASGELPFRLPGLPPYEPYDPRDPAVSYDDAVADELTSRALIALLNESAAKLENLSYATEPPIRISLREIAVKLRDKADLLENQICGHV